MGFIRSKASANENLLFSDKATGLQGKGALRIQKIVCMGILAWVFFLVAVPPAAAYNNVTHAWMVVKAVDYLKKEENPPSYAAAHYHLDDYVPYLIYGDWYADHAGPYCTWDYAVGSVSDYCDTCHHYGSLDNVESAFYVDVVDPGDYSAPEYAQILYDQAVVFWPGGSTPSLSALPYKDSGRAMVPGDQTVFGFNHVGGLPLCEFQNMKLVVNTSSGGINIGYSASDTCPRWPQWASTIPNGTQTKESEQNALTYLGWSLHMIQDMTQPYHARNDATQLNPVYEDHTDPYIYEYQEYNHLPVQSGGTYKYGKMECPENYQDGEETKTRTIKMAEYPVTSEYLKFSHDWNANRFALEGRTISERNWDIAGNADWAIASNCDAGLIEAQVDTSIKLTAAMIEKFFLEIPKPPEKIIQPYVEGAGHFGAEPTFGPAPLTVQFGGSFDIPCESLGWNFGDNSDGATGSSITHTYYEAGTYSVGLSCVNKDSIQGESKADLITVTSPLIIAPRYQKPPSFLDMILSLPGQIMSTILGSSPGSKDPGSNKPLPPSEPSGGDVVQRSDQGDTRVLPPDASELNPPSRLPDSLLKDGTACDDGNPCTLSDTVSNGGCIGTLIPCSDGDDLTADACDPETGQCIFTPAGKYVKHAVDVVIHPEQILPQDGTSCDDGNKCTVSDTMINGVCVGTAIYCDDGYELTEDSCDPNTGQCVFTQIAKNLERTTTAIVTPDIIHERQLRDGMICNDNNLCTVNDRIAGGQCVGTPVVCDDGDSSTLDTCDQSSGQCLFIPFGDLTGRTRERGV